MYMHCWCGMYEHVCSGPACMYIHRHLKFGLCLHVHTGWERVGGVESEDMLLLI